MGLIDDKKNVFTTIGAYTSLREELELPDTSNIFPSINNKNEITPFLLDILKVVVGSTALQDLTGELFTNFFDNAEPTLKAGISKQLIQYNSGFEIPDYFKNVGVEVPASEIDVFGKLKTSPLSDSGSLLYGTEENFDKKAYDAILNSGTDIPYNNLLINYNSTLDTFKFKANTTTNPNPTIGEWFTDFVNDTPILNKKEFLTNVMDQIYGSVSNNQNKTTEQLIKEQEIKKLIEQITDGDDSFEITDDVYETLVNKANELAEGVVFYDLGCGLLGSEFPFSGMTSLIETVSGMTDPFAMGNNIGDTVVDSTRNVQDVADDNIETIKDGFFQRLIQFFKTQLAIAVTATPQIRAILAIKSAFENNGSHQLGDPVEDLVNFKIYIQCVIQDLLAALYEFIFDLIVGLLVDLLGPIIEKIIREKINQYVGIIRSLISSRI